MSARRKALVETDGDCRTKGSLKRTVRKLWLRNIRRLSYLPFLD